MTTSSDAAAAAIDTHGIDPEVYHRRSVILAVLCLSLVLVVATVSSVNVAIPSIARELRPSDTQLLWIVAAYAVVFAGLLLPAGALGDRYGRKGALQVGLVIFAVASTLCAVMQSPNSLIMMRGVMGVGAALIMPSTLSLLTSVFPPHERRRAIAVWAGFAGAGGAIGPLLGGALVEHFWFGAVFWVPAPIALVALVAISLMAPSSRDPQVRKLDLGGALLSLTGFGALLFAIIQGPELGWTDALTLGAFALSVLALVGFVLYERAIAEPMLDMDYFTIPKFSNGALGITFVFFGMFAMFFTLTQYLQYVKGHSPLGAGLRGMPFGITMILVSPRGPKLVERFGTRLVIVAGIVMASAGLFLLSLSQQDTPYWRIALALVVMACGPALAVAALTPGLMSSVPTAKAGVGSAVNDTTREVGGAIGIAIIGTIVNSVYADRLSPAVAQLPEPLRELAKDSVARADLVAEETGVEALRVAARAAFVDAIGIGLKVGAAIVLAVAVVLAFTLPSPADDTVVTRG